MPHRTFDLIPVIFNHRTSLKRFLRIPTPTFESASASKEADGDNYTTDGDISQPALNKWIHDRGM